MKCTRGPDRIRVLGAKALTRVLWAIVDKWPSRYGRRKKQLMQACSKVGQHMK